MITKFEHGNFALNLPLCKKNINFLVIDLSVTVKNKGFIICLKVLKFGTCTIFSM